LDDIVITDMLAEAVLVYS